MAKSIVLYGVFLGAVVCLCGYLDSADIGIRYEALGNRTSGLWGAGYEVKGDEWSVVSEGFRYEALGNRTSGLWGAGLEVRGSGYEESFIRNKIKEIYSAEIGVREATGKNDGQRVEEYLAATQLGKGYAWCASFVSWVFAEAGFPQPRTPWSPALFPKERVIWERGKVARDQTSTVILSETQWSRKISPLTAQTTRLAKLSLPAFSQKISPLRFTSVEMTNGDIIPKPADVFGIYFANLKRIAHVGFVDEWGDKYLITVEGNTNEAGSNEGDGVYKKRRLISSIYQVSDWVKGQERRME